MMPGSACPCGNGVEYAACCEPLHDGVRDAATAEELMRSRYSAYAKGIADYLFRTWHPRTRPPEVTVDSDVTWSGLDISDVVAGDAGDERGEVEFTARYVRAGRLDALHERSRFERRAGRWLYLDGG
ncbi:YchJ family metal-binding protein [Mycobacterium sp. B14F4]|uniref:YchJ family protein n=1 Tax=Mycobacterium sp. B14F4 TaxID=3153565 RepID=UPI00325DC152